MTVLFYEAPTHCLNARDIAGIGPTACVVCRELTKRFEETSEGP